MAATKKEIVAEKFAALEVASQAVANAINAGTSEKEMKPLKDAAKNALREYNAENEGYYYLSLVETFGEGALKEGIKAFHVPGAKRVSYRPDKKTNRYTAKIQDDRTATIDLLAFVDIVGIDLFHDPDWYTKTQKFAFVVANSINKALGEDPGFSYAVDEAAKAFNFASDADPASANSGRKALQACVDGIVFIPSDKDPEKNAIKVEKRHWQFIRETMAGKGKEKAQVMVRGTAGVAALITEVISVLLGDGKIHVSADEG